MSNPAYSPHHLCHFLYELALWLILAILCLIPLHLLAEKHYNIDQTIDSSHVAFSVTDSSFLKEGSSFPIYRFFSELNFSIGDVTISSVNGNRVIASYSPEKYKWPMGRHGRVLEVEGSRIKVSVGSRLGFHAGDILCLYKDRKVVGRIQLQDIQENESWSNLIKIQEGYSAKNLSVSEYTVATQVVILPNPFIFLFELLILIFAIGLYSYFFIVRHKSPMLLLGNWLRSQGKEGCIQRFHFFMEIIFGIPFIWFIVNFFPRCFEYLANIIVHWSNAIFHWSIHLPEISFPLYKHKVGLYILLGGLYLGLLIWKNMSPIRWFWHLLEFKQRNPKVFKGVWRDVLLWSLHLIIFYAFGRTLLVFLEGNLKAAAGIIWPGGLSGHALSFREVFSVLRYVLWSITIVGCLIGYGYSVFGYLWGKRIRNLDFTFMGWATNAVCYSPLLGGVIWQMTPSLTGLEPIFTQGPLSDLTLIAEAFLNILYTLSIWNLGTMFGVMTDKGVRTTGFYSVVRHPSYTLEAFMFIMMYINGFSTPMQWLGMCNIFLATYYIRSMREDQFMSASNPEYRVYQQKTPYKFIPGIY